LPRGCKRPVQLYIRDPGLGALTVEAFMHPRGCMGASRSHLDIPLDGLEGSLLASLAGPRGTVTLEAEPQGGGCVALEPPGGLPSILLCLEGLRPRRGPARLRRIRGKLYLALPGL
jgi:hypothetical protein